MTIGQIIRYKRQKLGISGKELAERTGVTPGFISKIETGDKNPSKKLLEKINIVLDSDIHNGDIELQNEDVAELLASLTKQVDSTIDELRDIRRVLSVLLKKELESLN